MDTALMLRIKFDRGDVLSAEEIDSLLSQSQLIQKLTKDYENQHFFNLFRLISLSEIPYSERLSYTQRLLDYVSTNLATPEGFSYTGKNDDIVPCYNAMLLEAYVRLGKAKSDEVHCALNWIKQYQVFERHQATSWVGKGISKYGGCMKAIPCYIGLGKTVRALVTYAEFTNHEDTEVEILIDKGIAYMLRQQMFKRLSNEMPISKHITETMMPQSYMLSLTDLVYIVNKRNLWQYKATDSLKALLEDKAVVNHEWKIDYIYHHKGYKAFDNRRKSSEWLNYLFNSSLKN